MSHGAVWFVPRRLGRVHSVGVVFSRKFMSDALTEKGVASSG